MKLLNFKNLQLKTQTFVAITGLVLLMVTLNLGLFHLMHRSVGRLSAMVEIRVATNDLRKMAGTPTEGLPVIIERYGLHPDAPTRSEIGAGLERIETLIARLENSGMDGERMVQVALLRNMFATYTENFAKIEAELKEEADSAAINRYVQNIKDSSALVSEAASDLITTELNADEITKTALIERANREGSVFLFCTLMLSGLGFIAFYTYIMRDRILRPLDKIGRAMDRLATDASAMRERIVIPHADEIGKLAQHFNLMADGLQRYHERLEELVDKRTAQLESTRALLAESAKLSALGEMAGGIAHEVNTPLASIQLNVSILRELAKDPAPNMAKLTKTADRVEQTVERIAKIIKGLRLISRDAGQDPFASAPVAAVVDDAISLCSEKLNLHGVKLRCTPAAADLTVECRQVEISQVLLNLLNNAYDAIHDLPVRWVSVDALDLGSSVQILITDSGPGIPPAMRKKIFQPFFTTKALGKGTGLGLSISKGIIEAHGGSFKIDESCPNTRFVIQLPKVHPARRAG